MRRFLYLVTGGIILVAAILFALRLYSSELTQLAMVPSDGFVPQEALAENAYADPAMWFSRPGMGATNDPARWRPQVDAERSLPARPLLEEERDGGADAPALPAFAVFFVHPTSLFAADGWNGSLADETSRNLARTFVAGMASPFNSASEIWAPRYRQATFGAFLTDDADATRAIDAAYADVAQAFAFFLASVDAETPIVLAGHSQGALHVLRLLREEVGDDPALRARIAMVYAVGWPISQAHDMPALPVSACTGPRQAACLVSWASFAEPADPGQFLDRYAATPGFDGTVRGASDPIVCINPLTGQPGGAADMSGNYGTLVPDGDLSGGMLVTGAVPARCDARGLLLIGDPPELGPYVLPGNNYHTYDIPLFWANLKADVNRRMRVWAMAR